MKQHRVKVIDGELAEVKEKVTLHLEILDNGRQAHLLVINNDLLVPGIHYFILYPQYWSQQAQDNRTIRRGKWCVVESDAYKIQWKEIQLKQTVPWYPYTNVANIQFATRSVLHVCFHGYH